MPRPRRWTDAQLRSIIPEVRSLAEACERLGIPPGGKTYDALRRAIKRLGLDGSHLPRVERARRPTSWRRFSDDELVTAVATSSSLTAVARALGYEPSGGIHRYLRSVVADLCLDTSHFGRGVVDAGQRRTRSVVPLEELLVAGRRSPGARLRMRLIAAGLKEHRCEWCGLAEWRGRPIPLEVDHVNGDHIDNRLVNLRFLCRNCHALTDTWCNRRRTGTAPDVASTDHAGVVERQTRRP